MSSVASSVLADLEFDLSAQAIGALLATYGSPLYVYDGDVLRRTIQRITAAVPDDRTQFRFAAVTNGNLALLRIVRDQGWGLHANTPGDIYLGLQAGFEPGQIVYSGSNLSPADMGQVLDWGVTAFNLDSLAQVELCGQMAALAGDGRTPRLQLGLRLNHPALTGESRIGVRPAEFPEAVAIAARFGQQITGLHFYRGTGTNATRAFTEVIGDLLSIANSLPDWRCLDFGGGFGHPYRRAGPVFDWPSFGREVTEALAATGRSIELVIEPGRAAIAGCGLLLATVVSIKWQDDKQVVGVDTTVANLSVPSVHGGYREIAAVTAIGPALYSTDVCGNTTYSRDFLGKGCLLPALAIGDILAILDVGAYGFSMSSHFLHRPRPAEVLVENGTDRLIRKRDSYSILIEGQLP
jgi:diaminopimelate decarboxylase